MLSEGTTTRLRTQLDVLRVILAHADPLTLDRRPPSGDWSGRENLAHLARHHDVFVGRLRRILTEDEPHLGRYRAEDDPEWPTWRTLTVADAVTRLLASRRELIRLLDESAPNDFTRIGVHPVLGRMSLALWLEFLLLHEAHHLYVVFGSIRPGAPAPDRAP
jgi:hypothetical protein